MFANELCLILFKLQGEGQREKYFLDELVSSFEVMSSRVINPMSFPV